MFRCIRLLFMMTVLCSSLAFSGEIVHKLIVSSHQDEKLAQDDLLTLKVYFIENAATRTLKDKYLFTFSIEKYGEYKALTISPIKDVALRNALLVLLAPQFPDIFYVLSENTRKKEHSVSLIAAEESFSKPLKTISLSPKKDTSWLDEIGLQWIALWILALIGLILSIRSRRKMRQLKHTQQEIKADQQNIEKEITQLGEENV